MNIIWKSIPDWENFYEISNIGQIRSIQRRNQRNNRLMCGIIVKPILNSRGYFVVNLTKPGCRKQYVLHRLVLESFVGKRPDGFHGCHNDGNKENNNLTNLRWDTPKNNHLDKIKHGTYQFGEKIGNSKLTDEIVTFIRKNKLKACEAKSMFGLSKTNSIRIVNGKTWKHIAP